MFILKKQLSADYARLIQNPLEQQSAVGAASATKYREYYGVQSRLKPLPHVLHFHNWRCFTNELSGLIELNWITIRIMHQLAVTASNLWLTEVFMFTRYVSSSRYPALDASQYLVRAAGGDTCFIRFCMMAEIPPFASSRCIGKHSSFCDSSR